MDEKKEDLQSKFENEMAGVHCLPALMFGNSQSTIKELYLDFYDILSCKPLHTLKGHITNIYEELPLHLSKDLKTTLLSSIKASFNDKEAKRGSDYRKSLIDVSIALNDQSFQLASFLLSNSLSKSKRFSTLKTQNTLTK